MRRVVVVVVVVIGSVAGLALVAGPGRASLYSSDTQFAIPFEDGKALRLPFDEFKRRRAVLMNARIEPKLGEETNPDRKAFLDRIHKRMPAPGDTPRQKQEKEQALKTLPARDAAELASDLLRVMRVGEAEELLQPLTRARRPDYAVLTTFSHIQAARGDWAWALEHQTIAQQEGVRARGDVGGLSKSQREWWESLDRSYLEHFYGIRAKAAASRATLPAADREKFDEAEDILPLFPATGEGEPVKFVNDAGEYQPGTLASAERAKLPPDAVAVVQQMMLWFPDDVRLYWLLAELYAAEDDLESAASIFDECVGGLAHSNRKLLMEHRRAVRAVLDERAKPPEQLVTVRRILLYFGVVGVVALFALGRVVYRRVRAARA